MSDAVPVSLGQDVTLEIESLAFGGEGVGRVDGVPVFVPDVCPGERVAARVVEAKKRFARAALATVERPAPERVVPPCPLFGTCGGCWLQQLDYPAQVAAKTRMVADILRRVGHLPDVPVAEAVPSPLPYGYRNKVELTIGRTGDGLSVCYHQRDPAKLIAVPACPIALPEVNVLIEELGYWLNPEEWPAYDPETGQGLLRSVAIRYSTSQREANLLITTGRRELPAKGPWFEELRAALPQVVGLRHMARTRASQSAEGRAIGDLLGRPVRFQVGELSLRVAPEAFFQVNEGLVPAMVEHLKLALAPQPEDHLADLYGGVGTFGLALAKDVGQVTILELDPTAVNDARANIRYNQLGNAEALRGQVEQRLREIHEQRKVNLVILDPPRRGLSEGVIGLLGRLKPRRIAYVSCDPATLARDLQRFDEVGFQTLGVQPLDLFPQTSHIESIATLARKA